jgi:hypothetical protein
MKKNSKQLYRLIGLAITILFIGGQLVSVAHATPLGQDPRPPARPGDGGNGGGGGSTADTGGGGGPSASSVSGCTSVAGQVINWGFGPEANVGIELKTGSWRASTASASDGNYGIGGLGVGVGVLDVSLAPGLSDQLQPLVQNAGVYLTCDYPIIANLAISGSEIEPPATIEMSAPNRLTSESNIPVKLTVKNDLPNEITNVIVTDLMPPGLIALEVEAAAVDPSNARIIDAGADGQLVAVFLDKLAAGAEANIFITVTAAEDLLPDTKIRNTATLFYRESVADQAWLDFTVSPSQLPVPVAAISGGEQDSIAAGEAAVAEEAFVPPDEAPKTGGELVSVTDEADTVDSFIPPDKMPTTGGEFVPTENVPKTNGSYRLVENKPAVNQTMVHVPDLVPLVNDSFKPAGDLSSAEPEENLLNTETENRVEHRSAPIIGISGLLFIIILGLGGLGFWTKRSPLGLENQE